MAKLGNLLDDVQIKHWIKNGAPVAKSDGEGLTFTLSAAGTASWILRYRIGAGRRKELTIGNYPDVTLAAARKIARQKRAEVDQGADPAAEKMVEKTRSQGAWTVKRLVADYKTKKLTIAQLAEDTIYYRVADLDKVILPAIGVREVVQVAPSEIIHMIEKEARSWAISKRILTSAKLLFAHACGKRLIDINPCAGIDLVAIMGARPQVRKRIMLTEEELRTLLASTKSLGDENAVALKILLATCVRSVELVKAQWNHVDFDAGTWWVPDESVKTRTGFLVPLTPTVITWFRELQVMAMESKWVLPARTSARRNRLGDTHVGRTTLWAAITRAFDRGAIDVRKFTPHDTRSTAKGHMRNMGVSREISEIALNHKLKGMEGIYDVREEIPERRRALELWASFIAACEQGKKWNVIPMSKPARASS